MKNEVLDLRADVWRATPLMIHEHYVYTLNYQEDLGK